MTKLLRHDHTVSREEDGAVKFGILASMFHSKFTSSPYWSIRTWLNYLQKGAGAAKKRFQYCVESCSADAILYLRAIQGHSEQGLQFNQTRSNAIKRDHLVQHFTCGVHRKSGDQEVMRSIVQHPNREALKADLKQNHAINHPASSRRKWSTACETWSTSRYARWLPRYSATTVWHTGRKALYIVHCTCGTCLRPTDTTRKLSKHRFDVLSIPSYVIKKGPSHGARYGNNKEAKNLSRSSRLGKKGSEQGFQIHIGQIPEEPSLPRSTSQHRMGTKNTATQRCCCGRWSLLYRCSVRAIQTWKCKGACEQQFRSERPNEPTWRLPRIHENQRAIMRRVWQR